MIESIILLISASVASSPTTYVVTELGSLFGSHTHVFDMNEIGEIVGLSRNAGFYSEPFVWSNGEMTALPTFGGSISESGATDIRNDGLVVGYSATPQFHDPPFQTCEIIRAFRYERGVMTNLGALSATGDSVARAVNDAGRIVGWSHTNVDSLAYHAFVHENGFMLDIGTLGGVSSVAWDVNEAGQVTGEARTIDNKIHAFIWEDGEMIDIDTSGCLQSVGRAINEAGVVTGMWRNSFSDPPRSFLFDIEGMSDLGTLSGGDYVEAFDINNRNEIVGTATTGSGDLTGFIYCGGVMTDLRDLAPGLPDGFVGYAIDDSGRIAGTAWVGGTKLAYLLTPAIEGDVNGDGVVDFADLLALLGAWGPCDECAQDVNGDGAVNFADLLIVLANWS